MKKISLLFISCFLFTACSQINSVAPFDQEQAKAFLKESAVPTPAQQGVIISPRPTTDERQHLTTELKGYAYEPDLSANKVAEQTFKKATKLCKAISTHILNQNKQETLYQYQATGCIDQPTYLIGKAFNGIDGVYVVTFSVNEADTALIQRGATIIRSAKLLYSEGRRDSRS